MGVEGRRIEGIGQTWELGPWCITWHIPSHWEDPLMVLGRAVVSDWQPVPGAHNGECEIRKVRGFKSSIGKMYLIGASFAKKRGGT